MFAEHAPAFEDRLPGTQTSFTTVFNMYYKRLCLYAYQFVKDESFAEDLVQECFVKIWTKRDRIDFTAPLTAFLYTVVRNAAYDYIRNKKITTESDDKLIMLTDADQLNAMLFAETMNEIHTVVPFLPPQCRAVFHLLFVDGLDHTQAAKALNLSESTIRTQKANVVSFLKGYLGRLTLMAVLFFN